MSMRQVLMAAVMLVALTSVTAWVRRLDSRNTVPAHLQEDSGRCLNYMEMCVPWEDNCCNGMTCTNYGRGFCMHGLEPCICQLLFHVVLS